MTLEEFRNSYKKPTLTKAMKTQELRGIDGAYKPPNTIIHPTAEKPYISFEGADFGKGRGIIASPLLKSYTPPQRQAPPSPKMVRDYMFIKPTDMEKRLGRSLPIGVKNLPVAKPTEAEFKPPAQNKTLPQKGDNYQNKWYNERKRISP